MKSVAIIPARAGSKRIPNKNVKKFAGEAIISFSIKAALKSELFEKVIVSTDSEDIARIAADFGADIPFLRPTSLADDQTGIFPVMAHAVKEIEGENYDFACCILATCPLLLAQDLTLGYDQIKNGKFNYVFSATSFNYPIERGFTKSENNNGLNMLFPEKFESRSQDLTKYMHDAGQFYWGKTSCWLNEPLKFNQHSNVVLLPSWRVQDIDTQEDWHRAELIYSILESLEKT